MRKTIIAGALSFAVLIVIALPNIAAADPFGTSETQTTDINGVTSGTNGQDTGVAAPLGAGTPTQTGAGTPTQTGAGTPTQTGAGTQTQTGAGNPSPVPQTSVMNLGLPNPLGGNVNSLSDLVFKVVQMVVDVSYVVVAFFIILSGFKFVTAQGSDSKLEEAKKTFFYTIIGAVLVIGAQVIASVVQNIFNTLK